MKVLVVGAGFAGAVHARILADYGHSVEIIDQRGHIGGNAFDYVDQRGVRVHMYGPHLFHTSNEEVVRWLLQFGNWADYRHQVQVLLSDGRLAPMPINRSTVEIVFGVQLPDEEACRRYLKEKARIKPRIENAADYLDATIGPELTNLFFRPYNKKMWNMDLEEIDISVVSRVPPRYDRETLYFAKDKFQIMPVEGYTSLFQRILEHKNISVSLNTPFDKAMEASFDHTFNSMPIDQYYNFELGELPYRSIKFHNQCERDAPENVCSVVNFSDDGPYTRMTRWHLLPFHVVNKGRETTLTLEEPCDYKANNYERYYPVKTSDNRFVKLYHAYQDLSTRSTKMTFIGRCGTYQYLDMHQVINQSLIGASRWAQMQSA